MLKLFIVLIVASRACYSINPGPLIKATKGDVWPKPQDQQKTEDYFVIRPHIFGFKIFGDVGCPDYLDDALTRYWNIIKKSSSLERRGRLSEVGIKPTKKFWHFDDNFVGYLDRLSIKLNGICASENVYPEFGSPENYTLSISAEEAVVMAPSIWGILRGLETFSQLIYLEEDALIINATTIIDFPRFPHRGLLLDTSRHFIPVYAILETLDAMAYNKFNVFHWHLTDDQSFPYKSVSFPELSNKGAYHPVSKVYEQNDIKKVIEYARMRGIRVIPEFDTPGHTRSWGVAYPQLLTECYVNNKPSGELGPMDPSKNGTYQFLKTLFKEVINVFPDLYVHIGGDEVNFECWKSNPQIASFMKKNNISTYSELQNFFTQEVMDFLNNLNASYIVWEEVFTNAVDLPNTTIVQVWKGNDTTVDSITKEGKFALFSSCWYLDHLEEGGDWLKFYNCEILDFPGTEEQKKRVLGGEACMWSESVNEYNLISRVWPRASASAEKLWSSEAVKDVNDAKQRLEEHTCRMNNRGIQAQPPNGPGVCL